MNEGHLKFLSSPEWAHMLEIDLLPWVLGVGGLGDDVLEIGPGPGLTTDLLRARAEHVTAVEVDDDLARALSERLAGANVEVIHADATTADIGAQRFTTATCCSMLHHLESADQQGRLYRAVARALRPGGLFVGVDSLDLEGIREAHNGDTFNPVDPSTFAAQLELVGLRDVRIDLGEYQFRFAASKPG